MKWTYAEQSGLQHEFNESELPALIGSGRITADTLVWNETMSDWQPCGEVRPDLFEDRAGPPPLSPAERRQVQALGPQTPGATPPMDGLSLCAMIFGILGIVSCLYIFSIPAVICGHMGLRKANAEPGNSSNKGFAITGIITGYIGLFFLFLAILYLIAIFALGISAAEGLGEFESLDEP